MKENRQHKDTNKANYKQQGGRIIGMEHKMAVVCNIVLPVGEAETDSEKQMNPTIKIIAKNGWIV